MVGYASRLLGLGLCAGALLLGCGNSDGASHGGSGGAATGGSGQSGGSSNGGSSGGAATSGGQPSQGGASAGSASGGGSSGGSASGGEASTSGGNPSGGASPSGGSANDAGAGGSSEGELQPVGTLPADKIDLLFVIDNSISMADKQEILKSAVPLLVRRLVTPVCVDAAGNPTGDLANQSGVCPTGKPEFPPIRDFHIGVISSSLGAHGGTVCTDLEDDDKAHLLPSMRTGLTSWNNSGFLAWDPEQRAVPAGSGDAAQLVTDFQNMVTAAGGTGCGYEATLESWYRFLIDPEPPSAVTLISANEGVTITAPDATVLAQRAAFLRADSLVGIVILSDENDCSIKDGELGYLASSSSLNGTAFHMPRATSACAATPNDACCRSCASTLNPAGCTSVAEDTECIKGTYVAADDDLNLRCYNQKQRFGLDLLYPLQRYLAGLTESQVATRAGVLAPNPLFQAPANSTHRDPSHVFLLGIVGVPWQDVSDDASRSDSVRLRYLSAAELERQGRFTMMLGDNGGKPTDGLMFESIVDRSSLGFPAHPLTGEALAPSTSTNPKQNSMNGHETNMVANTDLQFACIFPLTTPRTCNETSTACDCIPADVTYNRALCQPPTGGPAASTQYFAKAYPSLRQLDLIRQFGGITNNSIAASICPKVQSSSAPTTDPNYGYNPAVSALVDRMKTALAPACLAEPVPADASGSIACQVLEVTSGVGGCSCAAAGHATPSASGAAAIRARLAQSLYCGGTGQPSCDSLCVCALTQLTGSALSACQNDASAPAGSAGFCYLDQAASLGSASLLEDCPVDRKRRLRFVGSDVPRPGSASYVLCP
ncbi:MAG: hypothetical protein QM756_27190 [Polyangiaceae bacterium]